MSGSTGDTSAAPPAKKKEGGLAGVVVGKTAIATVGQEGSGLTYRGYGIDDLAEQATFEEVAWLLTRGELPTRAELDAYTAKLSGLQELRSTRSFAACSTSR
jgi:2-methylcitrate synthase